MYVPNNPINFIIYRNKQATVGALTPASIRITKPNNDVTSENFGANKQPSLLEYGEIRFTYKPDMVGLYRIEIISTSSVVNEVMCVFLVNVVSQDTDFVGASSL